MTPDITDADLRVLRALFRDAHRYGRLHDNDFERANAVLDEASQRLVTDWQPRRAA